MCCGTRQAITIIMSRTNCLLGLDFVNCFVFISFIGFGFFNQNQSQKICKQSVGLLLKSIIYWSSSACAEAVVSLGCCRESPVPAVVELYYLSQLFLPRHSTMLINF